MVGSPARKPTILSTTPKIFENAARLRELKFTPLFFDLMSALAGIFYGRKLLAWAFTRYNLRFLLFLYFLAYFPFAALWWTGEKTF